MYSFHFTVFFYFPDVDILLHKFPHPTKDSARFKAWTEAIGGEMDSLDSMTIFKQYRICHLHFEPKYQSCSGRVTRNAVPTLLLSGTDIIFDLYYYFYK